MKEVTIAIALLVGLVDLIVMRRRGGLHRFHSIDLHKLTRDAWDNGGENLLSGWILTPNIAIAVVRSRRRMRTAARLKHRKAR